MIIHRDNTGKVIATTASMPYVPIRKLRARHEQTLCDQQMGIVREPAQSPAEQRMLRTNMRRVQAGLEPVFNDPGLHYGREDEACC